jgi:retron-type reverse transcriptase
MKSCPYKLDDYLSVGELLSALYRACRGKLRRDEIIWARSHSLELCTKLYKEIQEGRYISSPYYSRIIHEPKKRVIYSLPIDDRVVHQFITERYFRTWFVQHLFIPNTYACITGRGSLAAADKVQGALRSARGQYGDKAYVIQLDISKFFPSIDRDVLWDLIEKTFRCKKLKALIRAVIFDIDDTGITGLPIGNLTSQFLANAYLSSFDHQVFDGPLRKKYPGIVDYIRYMDDMVVVVDSKQTARALDADLREYLVKTLHLKINGKSNYRPMRQGVDFCGYITYHDKRFIRKRGKTAMKRIIRDYERGLVTSEKFTERARACWGHMQHADAWHFAEKHLSPYTDLVDFRKSKAELQKAARARMAERRQQKDSESWRDLMFRLHPHWDEEY